MHQPCSHYVLFLRGCQANSKQAQSIVQRALEETKGLGERVKAAQEEREKLEAEREAERDLAAMRAIEVRASPPHDG